MTSMPVLEQFLPQREVLRLVGLSRTRLWELRCAGLFPQPRQVGRRLKWAASDVAAWQAQQRKVTVLDLMSVRHATDARQPQARVGGRTVAE